MYPSASRRWNMYEDLPSNPQIQAIEKTIPIRWVKLRSYKFVCPFYSSNIHRGHNRPCASPERPLPRSRPLNILNEMIQYVRRDNETRSAVVVGEVRPDDKQFGHISCHNSDYGQSAHFMRSWALNREHLPLLKTPVGTKIAAGSGAIRRIPAQ